MFRYEQADAVLEGTEASLEVEATPWLSLSAKGDYVRGTNESRDEPLPLMPPKRLTVGGELHTAWDFLSRYKAFAPNPGRDIVLRVRMAL